MWVGSQKGELPSRGPNHRRPAGAAHPDASRLQQLSREGNGLGRVKDDGDTAAIDAHQREMQFGAVTRLDQRNSSQVASIIHTGLARRRA
jgi:hypothetical protein